MPEGRRVFQESLIYIMEAAFGRLHNSGAGAFGARPTVVESFTNHLSGVDLPPLAFAGRAAAHTIY